ncbi:cell division protein CdvA [Pyrofollis japonicus]|uniref:CdvA-like protein n=1 Tax=Pyrofollis japonicus TaxID=3060460 RepID=UPI00295AFA47|nr:CdvA-like protein [Pyrofollis japonicus]BEP17896.1 cell division protein CdvA [Pyrofollis japonicus]
MPRPPLTVERLQPFIGEVVYDPYGRVLGKLVSMESDVDGTVNTIVVETETRTINFVPAEAVDIKDGRVVVWPEWKTLAYSVIASYQRALKRLRGLEDMYSRNEIPSTVYREMRKKLDKSLEKLKEEAKKLKALIAKRKNDIEDENLKLDRAIANLKMSYLAGEINEKAYKIAIEHLRNAKDSNARELEDLKETKSRIESLESGAVEFVRKHEEEKAPEPAKTEPPAPSVPTATQPIPVKLIEG